MAFDQWFGKAGSLWGYRYEMDFSSSFQYLTAQMKDNAVSSWNDTATTMRGILRKKSVF